MIVVDTSALMAIILAEEHSRAAMRAIADADGVLISAATVAEALIVATRRGVLEEMQRLIGEMNLEIVTVTPVGSQQVAAAYSQWGKGVHPASLNFGDCFAYALAKARNCALLYVGNDFSRTDIQAAI